MSQVLDSCFRRNDNDAFHSAKAATQAATIASNEMLVATSVIQQLLAEILHASIIECVCKAVRMLSIISDISAGRPPILPSSSEVLRILAPTLLASLRSRSFCLGGGFPSGKVSSPKILSNSCSASSIRFLSTDISPWLVPLSSEDGNYHSTALLSFPRKRESTFIAQIRICRPA